MNRYYIGLATTFHDPALAIVDAGGRVVFAEAAERWTQQKRGLNHDPDAFMRVGGLLAEYCDPDSEFVVATSWSNPFTRLLRLGTLGGAFRLERLRRIGSRINRTLLEDDEELLYASLIYHMQEKAGLGVLVGAQAAFGHNRVRLRRFPHHLTHAAHACYTSPYSSALCAVVDGMGEFGSMGLYRYEDGRIRPLQRHWGRESLGFLYGLATDLCGYDWRLGEEWKVMGLASYGTVDPELYALFRQIYSIDGGRLKFARRSRIASAVAKLRQRMRGPGSSPLEAADMAAVAQHVFGEIMAARLDALLARGGPPNLALGGGCALNCSFNGTIIERTGFERLYVPCAPGDDGNAIGAALLAYREDHPGSANPVVHQSPYLGSPFSADALRRLLRHYGSMRVSHHPGTVHVHAARLLAQGKLLGWMQGRAEFGPRALGNRSILADPRQSGTKTRISDTIKLREDFRPYAPAVLHDHGREIFENYQESPYMERALRFRREAAEKVPAVVHVNRTGRAQTVKREWNAKFFDLVDAFRELTGVPLVLNTSYNIQGRPMVHSLEDAIGMFHTTGLDTLVVDDYVIEK